MILALRRTVVLATVTLLAAGVAGTAGAQQQPPQGPGGPGGGRGGAMMQRMLFEGITLSAEQQAKIDSIRASYREKMQAMGAPSPETMPERRKMNEEQMAAVRGVLTADQQKTYDENRKKMMEAMQQRMGGGQPPAGGRR